MARIDQDAYDQLKSTDWTYHEVANLIGIDAGKFDYLMKNRFDTPDDAGAGYTKEGMDYHLSYTLEWAERIRSGHHFDSADEETSAVLKEAGYEKHDN